MSFLDLLALNRIFFNGDELLTRKILNFTGDGVTVTDNPAALRTEIAIAAGSGGGPPGRTATAALNTGNNFLGPSPSIDVCRALAITAADASPILAGLVAPADADNPYVLDLINLTGASFSVANEVSDADQLVPIHTTTGASVTMANNARALLVFLPNNSGDPTDDRWYLIT